MATYDHNLSAFVAMSGNIDSNVLRLEVAAAIPSTELKWGHIGARFISPTVFRFDFNGTLDAGEQTDLSDVVAAHAGPAAASNGGATFALEHKWDTSTASLVYMPTMFSMTEAATKNPPDVRLWLPACKLIHVTAAADNTAPDSTTIGLLIDGTQISTVTVDMDASDKSFDFDFREKVNETTAGLKTNLSFDPSTNPNGDVRVLSLWERL